MLLGPLGVSAGELVVFESPVCGYCEMWDEEVGVIYDETMEARLAALRGWAQGAFTSKLAIADGRATCTREVDGGLETVSLAMPIVMTTDLRLNEPRYASLPNIMKAKKKPIDIKTPAGLGVDVAPRLTVLKVVEPAKRQAGVIVADAAVLVAKLRDEAGVI